MMQQSFDFKTEEVSLQQNHHKKYGHITEIDRLKAGKQILLGIACLYIMTLIVYLLLPTKTNDLLEIAKMVFPPLATLIIAFYFRDNKGI